MSGQFFIPRHDRKVLRLVLAELPELCADLQDTLAKQARLGTRYGARSRGGSPAPIDLDAFELDNQIHNALVGWIRLVCEHRGLTIEAALGPVPWLPLEWVPGEFVGPVRPGRAPLPHNRHVTSAALAHWLYAHLVALALTPGSQDALREIQSLKRSAELLVCPPPEVLPPMDTARVRHARALNLNARGIAVLARDLGEEYRHLTQRRVHVLAEAGRIQPVPGSWRRGYPLLFCVGHVLDAHLALPIRQRHTRERVSA